MGYTVVDLLVCLTTRVMLTTPSDNFPSHTYRAWHMMWRQHSRCWSHIQNIPVVFVCGHISNNVPLSFMITSLTSGQSYNYSDDPLNDIHVWQPPPNTGVSFNALNPEQNDGSFTDISNTFSCMILWYFDKKSVWNVFPWVPFLISHNWFRLGLGALWANNHYLIQCWPRCLMTSLCQNKLTIHNVSIITKKTRKKRGGNLHNTF